MKKLLASILACTMIAGTMSVAAFAAPNGEGKMTVTTDKTQPEIVEPTDPDIPDGPGGENMKELINRNIVFEETLLANALNRKDTNRIPLADPVDGKLGVLAADRTQNDPHAWALRVTMGDFMVGTKQAIPGFALHLLGGTVTGADGAQTDYTAEAKNIALSAGDDKAVFLSNETNGSPGYWAAQWAPELETSGSVLPGTAIATMTWEFGARL